MVKLLCSLEAREHDIITHFLFEKSKNHKFENLRYVGRGWILRICVAWWIGVFKGEGFCFFRFCVAESRVDFAIFACEILRNCGIAGGFESLKREGILLLAKAKSSKNFFIKICV